MHKENKSNYLGKFVKTMILVFFKCNALSWRKKIYSKHIIIQPQTETHDNFTDAQQQNYEY